MSPMIDEAHPIASPEDRAYLRRLAGRVAEIAADPGMPRRRQRWLAHNALHPERPMVLCFPEGAWTEILPDSALRCQGRPLRQWERRFREQIFWWEHIRDDNVLEPWFDIKWRVDLGDNGVDIPKVWGDRRGSYVWDPPLKDLDGDFGKLHFRQPRVDRAGTRRDLELADAIFGDLLPPRLRGSLWWTMGLTQTAAYLVGLEQLMMAMYDNPAGLHRLMAFLRDDQMRVIEWAEREGLLSAKNENDYTGSGGVGYTDELPSAPRSPRQHLCLSDLWGFGESQETVGISPAMFGEFVLPYQLPLLEKFGLNCYGCCEGLEHRIDLVLRHVPRLRRVSVAPPADQAVLGEKLAGRYIFSRKPDPVKVCVGFDEDGIRRELRHTLALAGAQPLELILKDTHTVQNQGERLGRWVRIAFEEIDRYSLGRTH